MDQNLIPLPPQFDFRKIGGHMPRDRHQKGFVFETGKCIKKWAGIFYVYVIGADGKEQRRQQYRILGLKPQMKKWEAEEKLLRIIGKETGSSALARPDPDLSFNWFWENRYWPQKEATWGQAQKDAVAYVMDKHVLPKFGQTKISEVNKFGLQMFLNELAKGYSESVVDKAYTYLRAALEEAVEQDFISKNPMRKVELPKTKKPSKRNLSAQEMATLLGAMTGRDRLIVRCFLVGALRPGELFALRWKDIEPGQMRIDERVYRNHLGEPKTEASDSYIAIPKALEIELAMWKQTRKRTGPNDFVFEARYHGKPMDGRSYLRRHLKPMAKKLGIEGLTYQALRRTFSTQIHRKKIGTIKDAQAQLRHANASTTMNVYTQEVPESVRQAIEQWDQELQKLTVEWKSDKVN